MEKYSRNVTMLTLFDKLYMHIAWQNSISFKENVFLKSFQGSWFVVSGYCGQYVKSVVEGIVGDPMCRLLILCLVGGGKQRLVGGAGLGVLLNAEGVGGLVLGSSWCPLLGGGLCGYLFSLGFLYIWNKRDDW